MKFNLKKIFAILIFIFVFIFMLVLNNNASLATDDFIYHFVFTNRLPTSSTKLITNLQFCSSFLITVYIYNWFMVF